MPCNANLTNLHASNKVFQTISGVFFHAQPVSGWLNTVSARLLQQTSFAKAIHDKCI